MVTALDTSLADLWELTIAELEALGYPFDELNQTPSEYLATTLTAMTGDAYSPLTSSFLDLVEAVQNELGDPDLSKSTSTLAELLAGIVNADGDVTPIPDSEGGYFGANYFGPNYWGRYFGSSGLVVPAIVLTGTDVDEEVPLATMVGTLSVSGGTGAPLYALDDDAGGKFALADNVLITADAIDYETATSHDIVIAVSGITPSPLPLAVTITVNNVSEGGFLLREDGGFVLREDGSKIVLEATP